jgi:hypothetical protein
MANKPTGAPPSPGRTPGSPNQSTAIKIAQISRWMIAGVSFVRMAELLNMTPNGVKAITETQEYKDYEAGIRSGYLTDMDHALAGRIDEIRKQFKVAVPAAMRTLVEAATQRQDLKAALMASKEILDRDPDRTLTVKGTNEEVAPGVPAEVLEQATREGNQIAESIKKDSKEMVN